MPQTTSTSRKIEVFRPGTFTAMSGASFTATAEDLSALAARYDAKAHPVPVVVGHPKTDAPAYGWVDKFTYDTDADRLFAEIGELEPGFEEAVKDGRYKRISMSFYAPGSTANPAGGELYPKHVGFLGAAPPAVPGLKPVQFAGDANVAITIEFGEPALRDVASIFRRMREFLIDKFDLETADQAMPEWRINWIDEAGSEPAPQPEFSDPSSKIPTTPKEPDMSGTPTQPTAPATTPATTQPVDNPEFAAREADITQREAALAQRERDQRHADHLAFAEGLINDRRLPTGAKPKVVALLDGIAATDTGEVSFSEDGQETKTGLLELAKSLFEAAPQIVQFGEIDLGDPPPSNPDDAEDIARAALAFQAEQAASGIEVSISDAVSHIEQMRGLTA
ncbi:hypothetical protein J7481_19570 [Labrenzia sp. R4_2]|uniref:hypothetical protein n=1 Tax=Labrenzia sp. R4_2 TaxID=2821107 RepID=UPI001ADA99EB|nr:hypothetical protein [Labrenzia sp. R4_2]MBO9421716.1 hypothetical protein [Labrenzia sp. R4_2]